MDEQWIAVQEMQDYITTHLPDPITLADLSTVAHYSPWYCHRLFLQWTGLTLGDYIRRLRLSQSALRLRDEGVRVTQVALEAGFGSVDGFQRAFLREFDINPQAYAENPVPIWLFTPYDVKYRMIEREKSMEKVRSIFIEAVERPARKAIIKRGKTAKEYFTYCEEVGCDVWGLLTSMESLSGEPVCLWLPKSLQAPGTSEYVQGVEVEKDYSGPVPDGFAVIDLPACNYLYFQGEPFAEEDYCEAIEALAAAVKGYDPTIHGRQWDRENPRIQLEPIGSRGYIELHPIR